MLENTEQAKASVIWAEKQGAHCARHSESQQK